MPVDKPAIIMHAHFYQPPRFDPWTGLPHLEPAAAPWLNWNEKIHMECYGRLRCIPSSSANDLNAYRFLSWDWGPFLWDTLRQAYPRTSHAVCDALEHHSSGASPIVAHPLVHAILPLVPPYLTRFLIQAGLSYTRIAFGQSPRTLWLPELAVNVPVLKICADLGIRMVIVSPRAIRRVYHRTSGQSFDPDHSNPAWLCEPFRVILPEQQEILVLPYHTDLSASIAFGHRLRDPDSWVKTLHETLNAYSSSPFPSSNPVVLIAVDGETYGHHQPDGLRFLAKVLPEMEKMGSLATPEKILDHLNPENLNVAEIAEESSWSCDHGFDRWRKRCPCTPSINPPGPSDWKAILFDAVSSLQREFERFIDESPVTENAVQETLKWFSNESTPPAPIPLTTATLLALSALMWSSDAWFFETFLRPEPFYTLINIDFFINSIFSLYNHDLSNNIIQFLQNIKLNLEYLNNGATLYQSHVTAYRAGPTVIETLKADPHLPPYLPQFNLPTPTHGLTPQKKPRPFNILFQFRSKPTIDRFESFMESPLLPPFSSPLERLCLLLSRAPASTMRVFQRIIENPGHLTGPKSIRYLVTLLSTSSDFSPPDLAFYQLAETIESSMSPPPPFHITLLDELSTLFEKHPFQHDWIRRWKTIGHHQP